MYFDAEFPEEIARRRHWRAPPAPGVSQAPGRVQVSTRAGSTPTTAVLAGLPPGRLGMVETLKHMRGLARAAVRSPDQIVRLQALDIVRGLSHRWRAQIAALQAWVQNSIAFIRDPPGVELVQTPEKTLELKAGDCDDQATLLAALLEATGHPARFIALGFNGKPFSHVLVQTLDGREWTSAETILKKPLGWFPGNVTSRYLLKV